MTMLQRAARLGPWQHSLPLLARRERQCTFPSPRHHHHPSTAAAQSLGQPDRQGPKELQVLPASEVLMVLMGSMAPMARMGKMACQAQQVPQAHVGCQGRMVTTVLTV